MSGSYSNYLTEVLSKLKVVKGPDKNGNYIAWCPFHPDGKGKPPHQPNLSVAEKGFICHACSEKGSLIKLAKHLGITTGQNEPSATYDYIDVNSQLLYQVCRYPDKSFKQRRPDVNGGWIWNLKGVRRVLYRLPELSKDSLSKVYIVEGEKDADNLIKHGLLATTNSGGASKWRNEYSDYLIDRDVAIIPDNDEPGRKHARQVANSLIGIAKSIKIIELPGLKAKGDVSDWLSEGYTVEDLKELYESSALVEKHFKEIDDSSDESSKKPPKSHADTIVELTFSSKIILFEDSKHQFYTRFPVANHFEIWPIKSSSFKRYLSGQFYQLKEKVPGNESIRNALNTIEARAWSGNQKYELNNRVAYYDKALWYDLSNENWQAVKITANSWEIVNNPPILFRRYSHQLEQIKPNAGSDIKEIFQFINISQDDEQLLFLVYLISCFIPGFPHPICILHGPQGSAKTSAFRLIKKLVDPSFIETIGFSKDENQLVQVLSHHWAPFFDNLSGLPVWASDMLCRAVTGEGYSKRQLYSDDDDFTYNFRCCVGLNGINVVASKPDLLDRSLLFGLEPVSKKLRKDEKDLLTEFDEVRPYLLGAIFDILAKTLATKDSIKIEQLPRMADFAKWGAAISEAIGYTAEEFLLAYNTNIDIHTSEVIEGNPIASTIAQLMENHNIWEGSASGLLDELKQLADEKHIDTSMKIWPKTAHWLTRRLNEIIPNLAATGIKVNQIRTRKGCQLKIVKQSVESELPF